jgi:hypothetical protein
MSFLFRVFRVFRALCVRCHVFTEIDSPGRPSRRGGRGRCLQDPCRILDVGEPGRPYSRAIVEACDSMPPTSTMTPDGEERRPRRIGRRRHQDRAAPIVANSLLSRMTTTSASTDPGLTESPVSTASPVPASPCPRDERCEVRLAHQHRHLQVALRGELRRAAPGDLAQPRPERRIRSRGRPRRGESGSSRRGDRSAALDESIRQRQVIARA